MFGLIGITDLPFLDDYPQDANKRFFEEAALYNIYGCKENREKYG
jgi:hypothetical protein